jgi:hypothetical protein
MGDWVLGQIMRRFIELAGCRLHCFPKPPLSEARALFSSAAETAAPRLSSLSPQRGVVVVSDRDTYVRAHTTADLDFGAVRLTTHTHAENGTKQATEALPDSIVSQKGRRLVLVKSVASPYVCVCPNHHHHHHRAAATAAAAGRKRRAMQPAPPPPPPSPLPPSVRRTVSASNRRSVASSRADEEDNDNDSLFLPLSKFGSQRSFLSAQEHFALSAVDKWQRFRLYVWSSIESNTSID